MFRIILVPKDKRIRTLKIKWEINVNIPKYIKKKLKIRSMKTPLFRTRILLVSKDKRIRTLKIKWEINVNIPKYIKKKLNIRSMKTSLFRTRQILAKIFLAKIFLAKIVHIIFREITTLLWKNQITGKQILKVICRILTLLKACPTERYLSPYR